MASPLPSVVSTGGADGGAVGASETDVCTVVSTTVLSLVVEVCGEVDSDVDSSPESLPPHAARIAAAAKPQIKVYSEEWARRCEVMPTTHTPPTVR